MMIKDTNRTFYYIPWTTGVTTSLANPPDIIYDVCGDTVNDRKKYLYLL